MTSSMVSRLLQGGNDSPSIYVTLRKQDQDSEASDLEERAGMVVDEENLREDFHDLDLDTTPSNAGQISTKNHQRPPPQQNVSSSRLKKSKRMSRPRWLPESHRLLDVEEADDEVPASLLIEGADEGAQRSPQETSRGRAHDREAIPIPGAATTQAQQQWQRARARQGLHSSPRPNTIPRHRPNRPRPGLNLADPKEKAMWRWVNVENLDNFLNDVYLYYLGHGFWSILLHRVLALLTLAFVVGFTIFLTNCIDYRSLPGSEKLSDILVARCTRQMGGLLNFILWLVCFFWIWKFFQYLLDIRRLRILHDFYEHLLGISEVEVQTISWQEIVSRLMTLRDANPNTARHGSGLSRRVMRNQNKQRMDAHDIANRLMRKENYMIALVNKDILDLTLPVPFLRKRQFFSRSLEWNIQLCVIDYVFNEQGQVHALFLKDTHRKALSDTLRRRFIIAGMINIFAAPLLVIYFLMHYFFRYFNEYQKNPSQIGSRQYNSLAEWKFREFNELWHLFQRRINMSYPFATRYVNQFPRDKTVQAARFVAFISGALASVLALASVIDPDLFLSFQLTPDRTVLFYLGIFGTTWAVARGMLPEENLVFDPEFALSEVIEFTHYRPATWDGRLHSDEVRAEFARLYQMKVVIFLEEILSMIFTPFILWFSLPSCSDKIIDFFREFTVHVDGLGYVCSFAEFNFKKQGNMLRQPFSRANPASTGQELTEDYYAANDQKLEASYWGFINDYARNPKTDIRFPYSRGRMPHRSIHPPPPFPGLMSPASLPVEMNGHAVHSAARSTLGGAHYHPSPRMTGKGSAVMGGGISTSPLTSILLDPHHQPSGSGFQFLGQVRARQQPPRLQAQQEAPLSGTGQSVSAEAEAEAEADNGDEPPRELVAGLSTGDLGSSWKFDQDDDNEDTEDEEEDVGAVTGRKGGAGGGVLGLIRQFQRAQGEGMGRVGSGVGGGGGIGL